MKLADIDTIEKDLRDLYKDWDVLMFSDVMRVIERVPIIVNIDIKNLSENVYND